MLTKKKANIVGFIALFLWIVAVGLGITNLVNYIISVIRAAPATNANINISFHNVFILGFIPFVDGRLDFGSTLANVFGYLAIIATLLWAGSRIYLWQKNK